MRLFTYHPKSTGETYFQHLRFASKNGFKMMCSGLACVIHSVFPFLFTQTASKAIKNIHQQMILRTQKNLENSIK